MDEIVLDIDKEESDLMELSDSIDRQIVERELDINVVVVASAGTGKTEALIRRMVASVVTGVVDIENVVAITFTRLAAGELRARFAERLREASATDERARDALRRIDRCFIGTIHAFCARMLRERPLEAGLRPDFKEVDEHEVTILWRHFWQDALQQLYADGDPRIDELRALGVVIADLYDFFVTRSENSDLELTAGLDAEPDLDTPLGVVRSRIEEIRALLGGMIPDERDQFFDQIDRADHYLQNRGLMRAVDNAEVLTIYRRGFKGITRSKWPEVDLADRVRKELAPDLLDNVIDPALTQWRQYVYGKIKPLIDEVVRRFESHRRDRGLVTFHDLMIYAARLLKTRPDVRRFFQAKYRSFLVDEFQDTDPLQAEIIMLLASSDPSTNDWRRARPDAGRLFIVGDEKQSIYRFRRADLDVFRLASENVVASGGKQVQLQTSFRSGPQLCTWINGAFAGLFSEHDDAYQAHYDGLTSVRSPAADPSVLKISIPKVPGNHEGKIATQESERIASYILSEIAGTNPNRSPGDFMILTRRRRLLNTYASALERLAIPYDIVGGDSLAGSKELGSLVRLLEVIRRPADEVAMLALLRGPLVGLGDDELYDFRKAGGRFRESRLLPDGLSEELHARLAAVSEMLARARNDLMLMPASAAIENIIDWTGLIAFAAGVAGGPTRAGNLKRAVSLVRGWEEAGMNWSEIVAELQAVISDRKYLYEQMTLDAGGKEVVRIMNLHQAKGLQAPVVILADAYQRSQPAPNQHFSRGPGGDRLSMPITTFRGGSFGEIVAEPVGWADDLELEKKYAEAEELRAAYVAASRAEDQLIVAVYDGNRKKGPWSRLCPSLASVPELDRSRAASTAVPGAECQNIVEVLKRLESSWSQASAPSVSVQTATGEDPGQAVEDYPAGGRGTDYGSIVHEIVQQLVDGVISDHVEYARSRANAAGISRHADELVEELELLTKSELWSELGRSEQVYSEVPFAYRTSEDTVLRGTIDLVYVADSAWKIVDFKTHVAESEGAIDVLRSKYATQLRAYASAWEDITGERVSEAGLWLTHGGRYVRLID